MPPDSSDTSYPDYRPSSPPRTRDSSPSPSISPTPALLACPPLDRCFSTNSIASSDFSGRSSTSRSSTGSAVNRRRGYVRPQGATFAESARNRDSVMNLGSIAHLQYYFARTGILDGKGAQLAREWPKKRKQATDVAVADALEEPGALLESQLGEEIVQSPIGDEDGESQDWDADEPFMLPPTVSTYSHRNQYVPPPPDVATLRRELRECLGNMTEAVDGARVQQHRPADGETVPSASLKHDFFPDEPNAGQRSPSRGWHEIQGMHILDVVTLAIKAAKDYYTMHEHPERLAKVKPERQIREDLLCVMDVLKRLATRNFAGGIKPEELDVMSRWTGGVHEFLAGERELEEQETRKRRSWRWLSDGWSGGERLREWEFMKTFVEKEEFPEWTDPRTAVELPTPFLSALSSGLTLVLLHNRILKKSKRQSEAIKEHHTDTAKPYRAADNLRYWAKAAEIRWETPLRIDAMGIVYNRDRDVWLDFDAAILQWCKAVREEIAQFWQQSSLPTPIPVLNF